MNESSQESSSENSNYIRTVRSKKLSKFYTPAKNFMIRENRLFNGLVFDKKENCRNKSNKHIKLFSRIKSNEISNNHKFLYSKNNNSNSNNQNLSNGETNKDEGNNYKDSNYDLISKKLFLIAKKQKKNSNKEKSINNRIRAKSQTSKNLYKLLGAKNNTQIDNNLNIVNNKEKIKEYQNKIISLEKRRVNKSKTIYSKEKDKERIKEEMKYKYLNIVKNDKLIDIKKKRNANKKSSFTIKKDNNYNKMFSTKINNHFPSLSVFKPPILIDKFNIQSYTDKNKNNLYKSYNNQFKTTNNLIKKKYSLPKKSLNLTGKKSNEIINPKKSIFLQIQRKQTFNEINEKIKSSIISNKLLKVYKLYSKNNKLLKKLKKDLKEKNANFYYENLQKEKDKEIENSLEFIENKINNWATEFSRNNYDKDQKIIFKGDENKRNKKKEKKNIEIIVNDFIRKISSTKDISIFYYSYHKGIIEQNILIYLKNKYFDFSLPSYIFEYKYNNLYLSKVRKKNAKQFLFTGKATEGRKMHHLPSYRKNSPKNNTRRNSSLEHFRKKSIEANIIVPLND